MQKLFCPRLKLDFFFVVYCNYLIYTVTNFLIRKCKIIFVLKGIFLSSLILLIIALIAGIRYVLNYRTIEKVDSLSDAISKTGKVADADFITIDDETKTYKIDLDKA